MIYLSIPSWPQFSRRDHETNTTNSQLEYQGSSKDQKDRKERIETGDFHVSPPLTSRAVFGDDGVIKKKRNLVECRTTLTQWYPR